MAIRKEGEIMPAFYYGMAYIDHMREREVYFIMPFNYLVRWKRYIHHWWMRNIQHRKSWVDIQIEKYRDEDAKHFAENYNKQGQEVDTYRNAYYEAMRELIKSNCPRETINRLHNLGE